MHVWFGQFEGDFIEKKVAFNGEINSSSVRKSLSHFCACVPRISWEVASNLKKGQELGNTREISAMSSSLDRILLIVRNRGHSC